MRSTLFIFFAAIFFVSAPTSAYPQFEEFIKQHSGRSVNCAFCHINPTGPEGNEPGQLNSLSASEKESLGIARAAMAPGSSVENPLLNRFGNTIIHDVGRKAFQQLKLERELTKKPEILGALYGKLDPKRDLDQDGIADRQEYLDGTHPLHPGHGHPARLMIAGIKRDWLLLFAGLGGLLLIIVGLVAIIRRLPEHN